MFGAKKKNEARGLPDLSNEMSQMPSINDYRRPQMSFTDDVESMQKEEIHGLPSFPDSPMSRGFSQSMIKSAVETEELNEDSHLPEFKENPMMDIPKKTPRLIELEEWSPALPSQRALPHSPMPSAEQASLSKMHSEINRPVFIRLDKFKEARDSLEEISEKVGQLDELLKMIKEVKARENAEINEWENEIEKIKARINFVNREIFENAYK